MNNEQVRAAALDTDYFGRKLAIITRDLSHYTPQEMARELVRLAKVADASEAINEALATSAAPECVNESQYDAVFGAIAKAVNTEGPHTAISVKAFMDALAGKGFTIGAAPERSGKLADDIVALLDGQKAGAKLRDGEWWRGYESALHWIAKAISEKQTETNHAN